MDGLMAAGIASGLTRGFDNFIKDRERRNLYYDTLTQKLLGDIDVVGSISQKHTEWMNGEIENIIGEASEKLRQNHKMFGKPVIDSGYLMDLRKQILNANQRFMAIKQGEASLKQDIDVYERSRDKFDPDAYETGIKTYFEMSPDTPYKSGSILAPKAPTITEVMQSILANPPMGVAAEKETLYEGDKKNSYLKYSNVTPETQQQALTSAWADPNLRRGIMSEVLLKYPEEVISKISPPTGGQNERPEASDAYNRLFEQAGLVRARTALGSTTPIREVELDPVWQQAGFSVAKERLSPELFKPILYQSEPAETEAQRLNRELREENERNRRQDKLEAQQEKEEKERIYVSGQGNLPDGSIGENIVSFKTGKRPVINLSTSDVENYDKGEMMPGKSAAFIITHIDKDKGVVYAETDTKARDKAGQETTDKYHFRVKIPLSKVKGYLKSKPELSSLEFGEPKPTEPLDYTRVSSIPFQTTIAEEKKDPLLIR